MLTPKCNVCLCGANGTFGALMATCTSAWYALVPGRERHHSPVDTSQTASHAKGY